MIEELPDYARKIASEMYPQTVKESYSQYEVEKLLIAVCPVAEERGYKKGLREQSQYFKGNRVFTGDEWRRPE